MCVYVSYVWSISPPPFSPLTLHCVPFLFVTGIVEVHLWNLIVQTMWWSTPHESRFKTHTNNRPPTFNFKKKKKKNFHFNYFPPRINQSVQIPSWNEIWKYCTTWMQTKSRNSSRSYQNTKTNQNKNNFLFWLKISCVMMCFENFYFIFWGLWSSGWEKLQGAQARCCFGKHQREYIVAKETR